jgi:hypothetical protein
MTDVSPTDPIEVRWQYLTRELRARGYTRAEIDAIPTEEEAWLIIQEPTPSYKSNGPKLNGNANPEIERALNAARDALRAADNDYAKLLAIRDGANALENIGAHGSAINALRAIAVTYGIKEADIKDAIGQGIEMVHIARTFGTPDVFSIIEHPAPELESPETNTTPPQPDPPEQPQAKPRDVNDILRDHGPDVVRDVFDKAEDLKTNSRDRKRGPDSKSGAWRERLIKPRELCERRFEELKYVTPGVIPEGVTLLASRPKLGKSWFLLQVSTAVANGVVTLVASEQPPHGDVLYLALEDNPRRLQRRLTKYFGAQKENWPERLSLFTTWRRLDQGGLDDLREWCRSVAKPVLISIDTSKKGPPAEAQRTKRLRRRL